MCALRFKNNVVPLPMRSDVGRQNVFIDKDGIVRFVGRDAAPEKHGEDVSARLQTLEMMPK